MCEDSRMKKEELLRLIGDADAEAHRLESQAQEVVQFSRFIQDVTEPLRDIVGLAPVDALALEEWDRQVEGWRSWHETTRQLSNSITACSTYGALTEAVTNTTVSGVMPVFGDGLSALAPPPAFQASKTKLFQTLERFPLFDRALASMRRLRLDWRGGNSRTPTDLLQEAKGALERPVIADGGPVSVLLPLRESIDAVLTELVRRRPTQGQVKGWSRKIVSVGGQCAMPAMPANHFERLGTDAETLMNELSGAKQTDMSRSQLAEFFNRGLLFLNALMDSIDESRLR
jgi:hypothetical protein